MSVHGRLHDAVATLLSDLPKQPARQLVAAIQTVSAGFTDERDSRDAGYMSDQLLQEAYLRFFAPMTMARVALLLDRLASEGVMDLSGSVRLIDLGAGPLSATLGAGCAFASIASVDAVDVSASALERGRQLTTRLHGVQAERIRLRASSLQDLDPTSYDAEHDGVIIANVLNELGDARRSLPLRIEVVERALRWVRPGGFVLIIEPALRMPTRALMAIRDALHRRYDVVSPCCGASTCPLLGRGGDWCHGTLPWPHRPAALVALEKAAGLGKNEVKLAHLLLRNQAPRHRDGIRLIGGVMQADRERRYGCGTSGLITLQGTPRLVPAVRDAPRGAWLPKA